MVRGRSAFRVRRAVSEPSGKTGTVSSENGPAGRRGSGGRGRRGGAARPHPGDACARPSRARWRGVALAAELPVARVLVDKGLLHLDKYFDYAVPEAMDEQAQPGVRVRVRFGARVVRRPPGGRRAARRLRRRPAGDQRLPGPARPARPGALARTGARPRAAAAVPRRRRPLRRSARRRRPARRAAPPGQGRGEAVPRTAAAAARARARELDALPERPRLPGGAGRRPRPARRVDRAARAGLAGRAGPRVAAALASGRGALVVLPDGRAVARVDDRADRCCSGEGHHVVLTADSGPEERYRSWLAVNRGAVRAVVGTRAAMFAPVRGPRPRRDLGRRRLQPRRAARPAAARP